MAWLGEKTSPVNGLEIRTSPRTGCLGLLPLSLATQSQYAQTQYPDATGNQVGLAAASRQR